MHCRACERWGEWSTEAITSLQSLLVIPLLFWKRTRAAWEEAMCSRQTDREKACRDSSAQKVSAISQGFGSAAAPLGTGSTRVSALCSVCQTSSYPRWTCHSEDVSAFKNPKASTFLGSEKSSRRMKSWVLRSCQDLWTLPERSSFVGKCGQSKSPSKASDFLLQTDRKNESTDQTPVPMKYQFYECPGSPTSPRGTGSPL